MLSGLESGVVDLAVAVFSIFSIHDEFTFPLICTFISGASASIFPKLILFWSHGFHGNIPLIKYSGFNIHCGTISSNITSCAFDGPKFIISILYVNKSPAITGLGLPVFFTIISANVFTFVVVVEVLLSGFGSGVVEAIFAVLIIFSIQDLFTIPLICTFISFAP